MLTEQSRNQLPTVIYNLPQLVERTFEVYESTVGKIEVDEIKEGYKSVFLDLAQNIAFRIESQRPVSLLPLYDKLIFILVKVNLDVRFFATIVSIFGEVIDQYIKTLGNNEQLNQFIFSYITLLLDAANQREDFFSKASGEKLIQLISEYAPSTGANKQRLDKNKYDETSRTLFTLIPKEAFWEEQVKQYKVDPLFYQNFTIYNGELYSLNDKISKPRGSFNIDEWTKVSSRYLNGRNRIQEKLRKNAESYVTSALTNAKDVNPAISDSNIVKEENKIFYDEKDLLLTFGGKGLQFLKNLITLKSSVFYTSSSESSPVGSVDYASKFDEYFFGCLFGRKISSGFSDLGGISLFGDFNSLYNYGIVQNEIPGLSFLDGFRGLKSFNQGIRIPDEFINVGPEYTPYVIKRTDLEGTVLGGRRVLLGDTTYELTFNPVAAKYYFGIQDKYRGIIKNPYVESADVDIILYGLERLAVLGDQLADTLGTINDIIGPDGRLPGYEGWGPMKVHIEELSDIFVSTSKLNINYSESKIKPGFNGGVRYLFDSYKRMSEVILDPIFAGSAMEDLLKWGRSVQNSLDQIVSGIDSLGYKPGEFVSNLSFKISFQEKETLIDQLRSLNFQENEINEFLSAETFEDLVSKFAPISDSNDQISFLRGYELAQMLYEFGGESAIDLYLSYLYTKDASDLESLLATTLINRSDASKYNEQRFGKLVGLLVNLTFAIDREQLELFKKFLSANQLTLFESISYLLNNQEVNLLKDKESISLLKPVVDSLIYGTGDFGIGAYNVDYATINEEAPVALKQFTEIINTELGDVSTNILQNLYDKSASLTSKEIFTIFGEGAFYSEYGQLMNGYSGGDFSRLINFAYMSGLLHKLSYYSNSYQVPNFYIQSGLMQQLVDIVGGLSSLLKLVLNNFSNSLEYTLSQNAQTLYPFEDIVSTSNKKIEEISKVIQGLAPQGTSLSTISPPKIDGSAEIIGAPGIGNSPVPESISLENSITPEQAKLLSSELSKNYSFVAPRAGDGLTESEKLNKFLGLIEDTKIIVGITKETQLLAQSNSGLESKNKIINSDLKIENKVPKAYQESSLKEELLAQEQDVLLNKGLISNFDPAKSCKKFGGQKCEERFDKNTNQCGSPTNGAIYSERDNSGALNTAENGSIKIDRPFGAEEYYKPSGVFLTKNVPNYFALFGEKIAPSSNGDPLINTLSKKPITFKKDGGDLEGLYSSYYNSEFGLIESIKANFEKDQPFKCSLLEDPYEYQACMNLLKCKKFNRNLGEPYLKFCPKTLAGGLLK